MSRLFLTLLIASDRIDTARDYLDMIDDDEE